MLLNILDGDGVDGRDGVFPFAPFGFFADEAADVGEGPLAVIGLPSNLQLHDDVLPVRGLAVDVIDHPLFFGAFSQLLSVQIAEVIDSPYTFRQDGVEEGDEEFLVILAEHFLEAEIGEQIKILGGLYLYQIA